VAFYFCGDDSMAGHAIVRDEIKFYPAAIETKFHVFGPSIAFSTEG
jgi:hypothetical protein